MQELNWLAIIVGAGVGGVFTYLVQKALRGELWRREDDKETAGKIQRVDTEARASIERVERELGNKVAGLDKAVARLEEQVKHLPTAADIRALTQEVSQVRIQVAGLASSVENQDELLITIRDHMLRQEA